MSNMPRENVEYLIIHCSATPPDMDIGRKEIDRWHRKNGWLMIGYHWVIRRNGHLEAGRDEGEPGAHARHYNTKSIGICMVGGTDANDHTKAENNFTDEQWATLDSLIGRLEGIYPTAKVIGHRDVDPHKACPCFDVQQWMDSRPAY